MAKAGESVQEKQQPQKVCCQRISVPHVANAVEGAAPLDAVSPLSLLFSKHLFQDGEIVELVIRPSAWWILLTSWRGLLLAALVSLSGVVIGDNVLASRRWLMDLGLMIGLAQLMWATVRWMSRIHILTNMRVMTISGVFNVTVIEVPLRRMARVCQAGTFVEKVVLRGSLALIPMDESFPVSVWQTIPKPLEIERKIRAAIQRAQQGGTPAKQ